VGEGRREPEPEDWTPATSRPGELYTPEGQSRARWVFLSGLRDRNPRHRAYRSSMMRLGLVIVGVGIAAAIVVGALVSLFS